VKISLVTSTTIAAISPGPRTTDTALNAIRHLPTQHATAATE
jgi:hypothetical protein